jgi:RNA polymerase sigma-70 factor (ECF subfamily)
MNPPSAPTPYTSTNSIASPAGPAIADTTDVELVRRMASGDERALGTLYDRWQALVHGAIVRILSQPDDVDDVVEEVFWQAWRQASRYEASRGAVHTWLLTIARSRALDRARALRRRHEESLDDVRTTDVDSGVAPADPAADAEASERRATILAALSALPPEQREAIELAYFQGFSQTEIAERTGQPLGTVKTRTRLAMQKLRERLRPSREDLR